MNKIRLKNLQETQQFAEEFAKTLKPHDVICLYGDLGSGKTTFVQGLAKGLGIENRIISPTFIIARHYKIKDLVFYHIDLYRTETIHDFLSIGLDEILEDNSNIVAIEWAEKLKEMLPSKRIDIKFELISENEREIAIEKYE